MEKPKLKKLTARDYFISKKAIKRAIEESMQDQRDLVKHAQEIRQAQSIN